MTKNVLKSLYRCGQSVVANSDFAGVIIEHSLYSLTDNVNNNHTLNEHLRTHIYL